MMRKKLLICLNLFFLCCLSITAQVYHEDDKEGLRMFLRNRSKDWSKLNLELRGLTISDTLTWYESEEWVTKTTNSGLWSIKWNHELPKRITLFSLNHGLAGRLDCRKFEMITSLSCFSNELGQLDVRGLNYLTHINAYNCDLGSIDVSTTYNLESLGIADNYIQTVDVSNNYYLRVLNIFRCGVKYLNVAGLPYLNSLECRQNPLVALNLSNLPSLQTFELHFNYSYWMPNMKLTIADCPNLEYALVNHNLEDIEIKNVPELKTLYINPASAGNLGYHSKISISNAPKLSTFGFTSLNVNEIDLSQLGDLTTLSCQNNLLSDLKLEQNPKLQSLECWKNKLTKLNLLNNPNIVSLNLSDNYFRFSTLPRISTLTTHIYSPQSIIDGGKVPAYELIDLSSEYSIANKITSYQWFNSQDLPVNVAHMGNGVFIANEDLVGQVITCHMKNSLFPELTLKYQVEITEGKPYVVQHIKLMNDNKYLIKGGQVFDIYLKTTYTKPDDIRLGLYTLTNPTHMIDLDVVSRNGNIYTCKLKSGTYNGAYMLMPFIVQGTSKIGIERKDRAVFIDKLPIIVKETLGWVDNLDKSQTENVTQYMRINIAGKVNEDLAIETGKEFMVNIYTTTPAITKIGLFYLNGTFCQEISTERNNYTYKCKVSNTLTEGDYIIMPYVLNSNGGVEIVVRSSQSYLMDRLPIKVSVIDDEWDMGFRSHEFSFDNELDTGLSVNYDQSLQLLQIITANKILNVEIYNIHGGLVKLVTKKSHISIADLKRGVYIVKTITDKGTTIDKIFK